MSANRAIYPIAMMCRVLGVSASGYHAWANRPLSTRAQADENLSESIRASHTASRGIYGAPCIHAGLARGGARIGRKRVARLMTAAGLRRP